MAEDTVGDVFDDSTIGRRLKAVRLSRKKSLRVVAGLAGISPGYLSLLERGERALDRVSLIVALADALQIAPSELIRLPIPAPANGGTDSAVEEIRRALKAVALGRPGGLVLAVEVLSSRVDDVSRMRRDCRLAEVGVALPGVIRDLHTSIAAGADVAELLELAVILHVQVTNMWLKDAGAPVDLLGQAGALARESARELDDVIMLALAAFGTTYELTAAGLVELAQAELNAATVPTVTPRTGGLVCVLTMTQSLLAAMDSRPADVAAPMDAAADLAETLTEDDPFGFGFGPASIQTRRMAVALEDGEPGLAASIARDVRPEQLPWGTRKAGYWVDYGRALARVRGRRDDAVVALRRAELISPRRVLRDPLTREILAELMVHAKDDAIGRELRGMAYRAGLPG